MASEVVAIANAITAQGHSPGVVCTGPDDIVLRRNQGFQGLCVGMDLGLVMRGLQVMLDAAGQPKPTLNTALMPATASAGSQAAAGASTASAPTAEFKVSGHPQRRRLPCHIRAVAVYPPPLAT